ncbi:hypothetical protein ACXZ9C_11135 [Streptococcus agalactiae]
MSELSWHRGRRVGGGVGGRGGRVALVVVVGGGGGQLRRRSWRWLVGLVVAGRSLSCVMVHDRWWW